jgi:hypothetical protein
MVKLTHSGHTAPSGLPPQTNREADRAPFSGDAAIAGAFMTNRMTALPGAIQAGDVEDDVLWLQPRSAMEGTSFNARTRETFRQVTVSLGLGALLTFGSAGAAVGPAAAASTTEATTQPTGPAMVEAQLPRIDAVAAAPIAVAGEGLHSTGAMPQTTAAVVASAEAAAGVQAPARDPQELIQFDGMRVPRWIVETILRAS